MTDLRTAAQQALEALELLQNAIYNIGGEHVTGLGYANHAADSAEKPITGLKAALAEPVQAKFDEVAVEQWKLRMVFYDKNGEPLMSRQPEPDEIRAALAQQAESANKGHK